MARATTAEPPREEPSIDHDEDPVDAGQINVPPARPGALWKVITVAIRCPKCGSRATKAVTGKRVNGQGFSEQYRRCTACGIRFRSVLE